MRIALIAFLACGILLTGLSLVQAATGVDGHLLKYADAFNCGPNVEIELRDHYRFRAGPGSNYRAIPDDFSRIRYDTRVLARRGDWLDLNGSIDLWVNIKDVYVSLDQSNPPEFNVHDKCLAKVVVRHFDSGQPVRHYWQKTDHGYVLVDKSGHEVRSDKPKDK